MEPFLEEVCLVLSRMLEGDFTTPVALKVSEDSLGKVVELLEKVREMFLRFEKDLGATVAQVASVVEEVQRIVAQTRKILEDSAEFEEFTAFLDSAFGRISGTIQAGEREIARIDTAFASFERLFRRTEEVTQRTQKCFETIERALGEVNDVFHRVRDIADHTRLVAINASIEAARAGVHGQTFSAVAQAIRSLAEKSAQIVASASQIVASFQKDVRTVLLEIVRNQEEISAEVQRVRSEFMEGLERQKGYIEDMLDGTRTVHTEFQRYLSGVRTSFREWEEAISALQRATMLLGKVQETIQSSPLVPRETFSSLSLKDEKVAHLVRELRDLASSPAIQSLDPDAHYWALHRFLEEHPSLEAIYTTRKDGTFVVSIPPAGLANARIRLWWQEGIRGRTYISQAYVSAITRELCVTVSVPILGTCGEPIGVLGADIGLRGGHVE